VELFQRTEGMPLVRCSGQNIDRLVTVMHASIKAGHYYYFALDTLREGKDKK
jgi:hypothetical protein